MNYWLQKQWSQFTPWHILLIPLSQIFSVLIGLRRFFYKNGWLKSYRIGVPVIVVGNISVGGTGKTPLVIWLANQLKLAGCYPGIISRGYGGSIRAITEVSANSNPQLVGDEPVLIAKRTKCPMFVGVDRAEAGYALLKAYPECNVIISDDGMQHYRLQRDFEIALVNSSQKYSNIQLLPAGPLREKISRLQSVDAIVDSGNSVFEPNKKLPSIAYFMRVEGKIFESIKQSEIKREVGYFAGKDLVAIAGIGNPERFFNKLTELGLEFTQHVFPDHFAFTAQDLSQFSGKTILMTEKDAVKCQAIEINDAWCLPITAEVSSPTKESLVETIIKKLRI